MADISMSKNNHNEPDLLTICLVARMRVDCAQPMKGVTVTLTELCLRLSAIALAAIVVWGKYRGWF
ncbi:hypothetical protein [Ruegeria aquimaris]|uniref:hypothetical protein n=1 Tax=Ruegeria aquimaris TaxID=2984333 RepID=UPI0021E919A3|nr:hypothetical protein [Ruegeria sp. XHP0148]